MANIVWYVTNMVDVLVALPSYAQCIRWIEDVGAPIIHKSRLRPGSYAVTTGFPRREVREHYSVLRHDMAAAEGLDLSNVALRAGLSDAS